MTATLEETATLESVREASAALQPFVPFRVPRPRYGNTEKLLAFVAEVDVKLATERAGITGAVASVIAERQAEVRRKWMRALRSGDYAQGYECLHVRINGRSEFCALGLLANIINPEGWDECPTIIKTFEGEMVSVPEFVREAAGLDVIDCLTIQTMNDRGDSFREIADWVRDKFAGQVQMKVKVVVDPLAV